VKNIPNPENEVKCLGHHLKDIFTEMSTSTEPVSCKELGECILALTEGELDYRVQNDTHVSPSFSLSLSLFSKLELDYRVQNETHVKSIFLSPSLSLLLETGYRGKLEVTKYVLNG